jgi:4-hydroxyphenylpyruvate dioxygenase
MSKPKFSILDHRVAGWYYPWIMKGHVPTSSPFEKKVRLMKELGYDGVGTTWWDLVSFYQEQGDLGQLKTLSKELDMPLTAYGFICEGWAFGKGPLQDNAVVMARYSIDLAHAAGCDGLYLNGPFDTGDVNGAAKAFREICLYADDLGLEVALEFMGSSPQVNNINVAMEIVDLADVRNSGLAIDTYHFFAGSSTFEDLEALPDSSILVVHLADGPADLSDPTIEFDRLMPGEGELPLEGFVQILAKKGFEGIWHVECIKGVDYGEDLREVAQRALKSTKGLVEAALSGES